MTFYIPILIVMTVLGAFAGMFLKRASCNLKIKALLLNYNLYIGALLYLLSAMLNIYVLRFLDYSVVLPLTSITYVWTMLISYFVLKEKITVKKITGVCLVILGAVIISFM